MKANESFEHLQHLINVDCALALSICKTRNLSSCVFVLSLLYMKRLRSLHSSYLLTKIDNLTTKELYLILILIADKYLIDEGENEQLCNSKLSELTDITNERINLIERQVLLALNWNLYVTNNEFKQLFTLFKNEIIKKLEINNRTIYFKFLPHIIEYLALTSLVLISSTLSILIAIHISTLTHSTLMKTFNPIMNCSQCSICYWNYENTNSSLIKQKNYFDLGKYLWIIDDSLSNLRSSYSIDIIQSPLFSRSIN